MNAYPSPQEKLDRLVAEIRENGCQTRQKLMIKLQYYFSSMQELDRYIEFAKVKYDDLKITH